MVETKYLRRVEAAEYLKCSANFLAKLAMRPGGPPFFKMGHSVLYDRADLDRWLAARKVASTLEKATTDQADKAA